MSWVPKPQPTSERTAANKSETVAFGSQQFHNFHNMDTSRQSESSEAQQENN
jgi:hypothetical protein